MGKVLIYILTEGKGGVEEYVMNFSRYIENPASKYGYLVMGESTVYEEELKRYGIEYFFIPRKTHLFENIKSYKTVLKKLRNEYDSVYFNTSGLYYPIPYIFAIKYKYRIIIHSHSSAGVWPKRIIHKINRWWVNKHSDIRLACSTHAGKWMFGKKRFELIPNAIDLNRFEFDENKRNACRERFGINNAFVIGNVGRLHQLKNQVFLVEILYRLLQFRKDAILLLVGDGEMKESIANKAEELGVRQSVIFTGATSTPEDFYSAMDCFVMPSILEGFPVTLVEAQANGMTCVVSDTITDETNITGHVIYMSLQVNSEKWAETILHNTKRYNDVGVLRKKGFDIHELEDRVYNMINDSIKGKRL